MRWRGWRRWSARCRTGRTLERFLPAELGTPLQRRAAMASTLLAGLEMARDGQLRLRQERPFGPILLRRGGQSRRPRRKRMTNPVPDPMPAAAPAEALEDALRLAEALLFAAAAPVGLRALAKLLPVGLDAEAVVAALRERYAGRGVELAEVAGGLQFRTAPDLAPRLRRVVEVPRRLPRAAMETLAIVAYHQPVTRPRSRKSAAPPCRRRPGRAASSGLIAAKGRKETPGRPTLWATTPGIPGAVRAGATCATCRGARTCWSSRRAPPPADGA